MNIKTHTADEFTEMRRRRQRRWGPLMEALGKSEVVSFESDDPRRDIGRAYSACRHAGVRVSVSVVGNAVWVKKLNGAKL